MLKQLRRGRDLRWVDFCYNVTALRRVEQAQEVMAAAPLQYVGVFRITILPMWWTKLTRYRWQQCTAW